MNNRRKLTLALSAGALGAPLQLQAQQPGAYPNRPVRIIVAAAAGGGDDIPTCLLAAKLSEVSGQQFVVENRPGAGGMIGQTYVAKAAPDSYTLLSAGGSMAGQHLVNANMGYDLQRDFTPISLIETVPCAFVAKPALPDSSRSNHTHRFTKGESHAPEGQIPAHRRDGHRPRPRSPVQRGL